MTAEDFKEFVNCGVITRIRSTLDRKRVECAGECPDVLVNFKRGADTLGKTPEEVCLGYMTEEFMSVVGMVEELADHKAVPDAGVVSKWVGDLINYLILLEALFGERRPTAPTGAGQSQCDTPAKPRHLIRNDNPPDRGIGFVKPPSLRMGELLIHNDRVGYVAEPSETHLGFRILAAGDTIQLPQIDCAGSRMVVWLVLLNDGGRIQLRSPSTGQMVERSAPDFVELVNNLFGFIELKKSR